MLSNSKAALYGILVGVILGIGAAVIFLGAGRTVTATRTRIVYRDAPRPPRLVLPPVASVRTLYRIRTDTVVVRIPVPADLRLVGVIGTDPVDIHGRQVDLRWWSPDSLRWITDSYRLQDPRLGWGVLSAIGRDAAGYAYASTTVEARIGRVSLGIGPAYTTRGAVLAFSLRYRLLGVP